MRVITRAMLVFIAAVASVLTFHAAAWWAFFAAGLLPVAPYPMRPTAPWGVPVIVSLCFWGGLYGAAFGVAIPRLRAPLWLCGLAVGVLAALVGMFLVPVIKGTGIQLTALGVVRSLAINGAFGLGLGLITPALMARRAGGAFA